MRRMAMQAGQWQRDSGGGGGGGGGCGGAAAAAAAATFSFEVHERLLEVEVRDTACQTGGASGARAVRRQLTESTQTHRVLREAVGTQTEQLCAVTNANTQTDQSALSRAVERGTQYERDDVPSSSVAAQTEPAARHPCDALLDLMGAAPQATLMLDLGHRKLNLRRRQDGQLAVHVGGGFVDLEAFLDRNAASLGFERRPAAPSSAGGGACASNSKGKAATLVKSGRSWVLAGGSGEQAAAAQREGLLPSPSRDGVGGSGDAAASAQKRAWLLGVPGARTGHGTISEL